MGGVENISVNNPGVPIASNRAAESQFVRETNGKLGENTDAGRALILRTLRGEIVEVDNKIKETINQIGALPALIQQGIKKAGGNEKALAINARLALENESVLMIQKASLLAKKQELEERLNAA